jgi:hypothetical protein
MESNTLSRRRVENVCLSGEVPVPHTNAEVGDHSAGTEGFGDGWAGSELQRNHWLNRRL